MGQDMGRDMGRGMGWDMSRDMGQDNVRTKVTQYSHRPIGRSDLTAQIGHYLN